MPRRTASDVMEQSVGPNPSELRAGASISPDMVNVFQQAVTPGASRGLHLAPIGGRPAGDAIALSVMAWVRNVSYDKELWLALHVVDADGKPLHAEIVPLTFQEPAEGGGDFFAAGAAIPAPTSAKAGARSVAFRLYGHMQGHLYTDGILHTHKLESGGKATTEPAAASATKPAAASATKPAAPKTTRSRAPKATTTASPKPATPRKPRTPKA